MLGFLSGCSTELDVNAPYKEVKVIYALLDPREPFQTVRISKGFQNEGRSAEDIARNSPDSSLYGPGILKVELLEVAKNGQIRRAFVLNDTIISPKDSGLFYYPEQLVYKSPDFKIDSTVNYKVRVTNTRTGSISEASTSFVGRKLRIISPIQDNPSDPLTLAFSSTRNTELRLERFSGGAVMQAYLHWNIRTFTSPTEFYDEVWSWNAPNELSFNNDADNQARGFFAPAAFWNFLRREADARGGATVFGRKIQNAWIEVVGASTEYKTYREVFNNYNSLTQSLPYYTNVSNGLGVVAFRNGGTFPLQLDNASADSIPLRVPQFKIIK